MNLTPKMRQVLENLRAAVESEREQGWGSVYLDNAKKGLSPRSFAGTLAALEKAGLYKSRNNGDEYDRVFGSVKLEERS